MNRQFISKLLALLAGIALIFVAFSHNQNSIYIINGNAYGTTWSVKSSEYIADQHKENIINIINNKEIIPELLQNECNANEIYKSVIYFLKNPELIKKQLTECSKTLEGIRSKTSSADEASSILLEYLY